MIKRHFQNDYLSPYLRKCKHVAQGEMGKYRLCFCNRLYIGMLIYSPSPAKCLHSGLASGQMATGFE